MTILAAWVRLGYVAPGQAAFLLQSNECAIKGAVTGMQQWQAAVEKQNKYVGMHGDQNFSGLVRDIEVGACPAAIETEEFILDSLHKALVPRTLADLSCLRSCVPDASLKGALHLDRPRAGAAMSSLSATSNETNVGK